VQRQAQVFKMALFIHNWKIWNFFINF
jgi:hypothetical protein